MSKESVFKKIAEIGKSNVELKSEVIELGVMQDMQKWEQITLTQSDELVSVIPRLKTLATEAYNSPAKALKSLEDSIKLFEKDAKVLGLSPNEFKPFNEASETVKKVSTQLDKFYSQVLRPLLK